MSVKIFLRVLLNLFFPNKRFSIKEALLFGSRMLIYSDQHTGRKILLSRFEREETEFLDKFVQDDYVCLDIGCNSGHVTLFVAKTFSPERITGIDIDPVLIGIARKNILHCLEGEKDKKQHKFPASMEKLYGPITPRGHSKQTSSSNFPGNILFRCVSLTKRLEFDGIGHYL